MSKKHKNKKFFGFTDGYRPKFSIKTKGVDYIKYGYPFNVRTRAEIVRKAQEDLDKEEINNIDN